MEQPRIRVQLDEGAFMPERAHDTDAGADIRTPKAFMVPANGCAVVSTGIHVELPEGTVGMLKSKSGLYIKSGITSEGVLDEGFTGEVVVRLQNHSATSHWFDKGDKITQLVVLPVAYPDYMRVNRVHGGERGDAGYGSTGR